MPLKIGSMGICEVLLTRLFIIYLIFFARLNTWQLSQIGEKKQRSLYVSAEGRVMVSIAVIVKCRTLGSMSSCHCGHTLFGGMANEWQLTESTYDQK